MKMTAYVSILIAVLILCSAQTPAASSSLLVQETPSLQGQDTKTLVEKGKQPEPAKGPEQKPVDTGTDVNAGQKEENGPQIADPLYPWNKAMYHFNDKFYFWLMKPVAQGYSSVVPEDVRLSVSNVFRNITTPVRFVSNLLQLKIKNAGNELVRFVYNSTAGVGGLADTAKTDLHIRRHDEDLGRTFGAYGIGHGFYIIWPVLGPSSLRDSVGLVGDTFLNPVSYVEPIEASLGISAYDMINETSFYIGDYEDLKKSAVDPYISIRDAYIQYRKKEVEE
jgi:phospholipid-binding lipoprotein MlaA